MPDFSTMTDAEVNRAVKKAMGYTSTGGLFSPVNRLTDTWEMEESIPEDEQDTYAQILCEEVIGKVNVWAWSQIRATPRQRCEAFLAWHEAQKKQEV